MKKKQVVALGLAALMVASLAACGNSGNGGNASNGSAANEQTSGNDKVISFWNIATEGQDKACIDYGVDQYNKNDAKDTGYTIEQTNIQNDKYKEKLVIAMSSGQCPDMYTSWSGGPLAEYIESGYAQPITDLYKEAGLDKIYMEAATQQATFNNEIYAVPVINVSVSGVFYNKEMFDKYGLKEPKTISELEKICDTLKENGVTPFALGNSTKWQGSMFYQGFATRYAGLKDFRAAYDGTGTFEADCFKYAGNKIADWVKKGYFQEGMNSISTDDGQDRQAIYQEKAAMLYSGSWYCSTFKNDDETFYSKMGWFPFPECDEVSNGADYANICNGTVGDQFISFNCKDDKLKAAFKCATYYSTDEGIQTMIDQGKIPPVNGVKDKLTDPLSIEICEFVENATDVQLWYDQYLPPAVANAHLDSCQEIFGGTMTSEQAAKATQDAMTKYLDEKK